MLSVLNMPDCLDSAVMPSDDRLLFRIVTEFEDDDGIVHWEGYAIDDDGNLMEMDERTYASDEDYEVWRESLERCSVVPVSGKKAYDIYVRGGF